MNDPDKIIHLLQDEVRATAASKYGQSLESADAHVIARARRDYLNTQRAVSSRVIESLSQQENTMTTNQTNNPGNQQQEQQQQDHISRYPFPSNWPVTGPFANQNQE